VTAPLSEQQLAEIAARAEAATPGPWEPYTEYGLTFYANVRGEYLRGVGDINLGVGEQAEADLAFVLAAREDVPALLDEVERLGKVEDDLTGTCLSLWEEEQYTTRLRLALASAQRGRSELRARVAELEATLAADERVS
jgi:hypothetical protein